MYLKNVSVSEVKVGVQVGEGPLSGWNSSSDSAPACILHLSLHSRFHCIITSPILLLPLPPSPDMTAQWHGDLASLLQHRRKRAKWIVPVLVGRATC